MKHAVMTGLLLSATLASAADVEKIVAKANEASYYAGKDGRADVTMTIKDNKGVSRTREFRILRLDLKKGNQKFYVYFKAPADVRKMAFLVWKNVGKDDNRWLWMPALGKVKPIAPGDKRTSFAGSDFLYEDVSGRGLAEDTHELVETTDAHYVIKNTPRDPGGVEFAHYTVWIDKTTFLPMKGEYTNKNGKVYRRVEARKVETIDGHPTVTEAVASDLERGSTTVNTFSNVKYDIGLRERSFTERYLRRPPREAVR